MYRKPLFWFTVSVMCLAGAAYFWHLGDQWQAQRFPAGKSSTDAHPAAASSVAAHKSTPAPVSIGGSNQLASTKGVAPKDRYPYRLKNTDQTPSQLLKNNKGILLMNALLDTGKPMMPIPDRLRAAPNSGSYVVQANGPLTDQFRAALRDAGATIVSYIPNNAYLVRVSDSGAQQLQSAAQSVLPYEPYYKLDPSLLKMAMEQPSALPPNGLTVTVFPDAYQTTVDGLAKLGAYVLSEDKSPFGPVLKVFTVPNTLSAIASLPGVQGVAPARARIPSNDLMRPTLGVSFDSIVLTNYLNLTGSNILVNINDFGVDQTHPDFGTNRLTSDVPSALIDTLGHGTHVAGTILGSGLESSTVTNAQGSVSNANFRGMAFNANGYVLSLDNSDAYLQETAAKTNAVISNNSWNYGGSSGYDIAAASYDAAVRDALPEVTGPQGLTYVFSAGDAGNGADDGGSGQTDSILSPATGKNVITVGAVEQPRFIVSITTNLVGGTNVITTNTLFEGETDNPAQVAGFSSRGNVGVNIEGNVGRFKPDVVAPGTFVISDRSTTWDTASYYNPTNFTSNSGSDVVGTNSLNAEATVFLPANLVGIIFTVSSNKLSPFPMPDSPIYVRVGDTPTLTQFDFLGTNTVTLPTNSITFAPGESITFSVGNAFTNSVAFNWTITLITTNDNGFFLALSNVNNGLEPWYRYETGTSMAAAGVSGMLACMADFFQNTLHLTNSPALMKALLINGSRTLGQPYDFNTAAPNGNSEGWGQPFLPNIIPPAMTSFTTGADPATFPLMFLDQNPTNVLATGQSKTRTLALSSDGQNQDLRVTLVWTDPPGNPAAGVKLVNDLDLIVSNTVTHDVYYGNDIPGQSKYSQATDTNNPANIDSINNVENVFLKQPLDSNYVITVFARRVNVNAVDSNTNDIVQDYALVVSSGDVGGVTNPFTSFTDSNPAGPATNIVTNFFVLSNGVPLFNQRVGANSQFTGTTNGSTNQWNFYVYTNPVTNDATFTNVAIVTFASPNLGTVRMGASTENGAVANGVNTAATRYAGADLDLYVSTDPALTNLDTNAVNAALKSTGSTGAEKILITNSAPGTTYYIGIKSEDQQAAQFQMFAIATDTPFSQTDGNGNVIVTILTPLPITIPGGSPGNPNHALVLGVTTSSSLVQKVVVTDEVQHTEFGDLIGTLSHSQKTDVLNNHSFFTNVNDAFETFTYDDSGANTPGTRPSDGPGSLQDFVGDTASDGVWMFTMVNDSSTSSSGSLTNIFNIAITPQPATNGFPETINGDSWFYDFVDVPDTATNLTITVTGNTSPVDLFIRRGDFPTLSVFDKSAVIAGTNTSLSISKFESPPLNAGRYYFGIFNPSPTPQNVFITIGISNSLTPINGLNFLSVGNEVIADDAVTYSTNTVGQTGMVVSAEVGVRIDHSRESDLVLTLISPQGTRVLLAENRGGLDTNGYGTGINTTNFFPQTSSGGLATTNFNIPLTISTGTLIVTYDFFGQADDMQVFYGTQEIFDTGLIPGAGTISIDFGPGSATNLVIAMNPPGTNPSTNTSDQWNFTASVITRGISYTIFTDDTNQTTLPIKFAVPPFTNSAPPTPPQVIFASSFEGADSLGAHESDPASGVFTGVTFDGWTVGNDHPGLLHQPEGLVVPQLANDGSNVLALHNGSISRVLTNLIPDRNYMLTFAYHGRPIPAPISWWTGDNGPSDVENVANLQAIGHNPTVSESGVVTNGFLCESFFGVDYSRMFAADVPALQLTTALTVEAWVSVMDNGPSTIIERGDNTGTNNAYHLGVDAANNLEWYVTGSDHVRSTIALIPWPEQIRHGQDGPLDHVAGTYDSATSNLNLYINGALVSSKVQPTTLLGPLNSANFPGIGLGNAGTSDQTVNSDFGGVIDEMTVYGSALSLRQIQDIYAAGSAGKRLPGDNTPSTATLTLDTNAYPLSVSQDEWLTNTITFTATNTTMTLTIAANSNLDGTFQDGILLDSFVLQAQAVPSTANYYLPEESLAKLAGESATGNWLLEVLDNRLGATNPTPTLVSWQLNLVLADTVPFAFPLSSSVTQTNSVGPGSIAYFAIDVPPWAQFATNVLTDSGPLNLLFNQNIEPSTNLTDFTLLTASTGGTSILSTTNTIPTLPVLVPGQRYFLGVQNKTTATINFTLRVDFDITTLSNAVPVAATIPAGNIPRYFQFDVDSNAVVTLFQTTAATGNLEMVVRKGAPLPDTSSFDYFSAVPSTPTQSITVLTNSPVPISPGRWYIGVFNTDTNPVSYTITATEGLASNLNIIPLTNGVPFNFVAAPGLNVSNFFVFSITNSPGAALFELYNLDGDVDLTLDSNSIPYSAPFLNVSSHPGTNHEQIVIRTNITVTNLNANWYLGVPNQTNFPVNFTIRAIEATNGILPSEFPISLTVTTPPPGATMGPSISWPSVQGELYEIEVSPDLVSWTVLTTVPGATLTTSFIDPSPITIGARFYRIVQIPTP